MTVTAEQIRLQARPMVVKLLEIERKAGGKALEAAKRLGRKVSASGMWVKRIVGRYGQAHIHAHQWENLKALYHRVHEREQQAVATFKETFARGRQRYRLIRKEVRA